MSWSAQAFAPAHVTGFFEVRDDSRSPYRKGSRGAGLNLELGVTAEVTVDAEGRGIAVTIDGEPAGAPTVQQAVTALVGQDYQGHIQIDLEALLPASQGFGLSGAGALAAGLALAKIIGFPTKTALWEAHKADVLTQSGLGDVPAQYLGGAEIRITPGPMPMGFLERFAGLEARHHEVLCCVLEKPLATESVLGDPDTVARINAAGAQSVDRLRADPTLANYMALSRRFTDTVGLVGAELQEALTTADGFGAATQTMLGNALHLLVDTRAADADPDGAEQALRAHGNVYRTRIARRGAHALREPATTPV